MIEIWKDIQGYEGKYKVSNLGNVKSTYSNKILLPSKCKWYLYVYWYKNKIRKGIAIHRIVAQTFIENLHDLPVVNHKDECKTNNCVNNLEWCSYLYNNTYGTKLEKVSKCIDQYKKDGTFIKTWSSTQEAERSGFNHGNIILCCKGKRITHKGYIWKYHE